MTDSGESCDIPRILSNNIVAYRLCDNKEIVFFNTDRGDVSSRTTIKALRGWTLWKDKILYADHTYVLAIDCPYLS